MAQERQVHGCGYLDVQRRLSLRGPCVRAYFVGVTPGFGSFTPPPIPAAVTVTSGVEDCVVAVHVGVAEVDALREFRHATADPVKPQTCIRSGKRVQGGRAHKGGENRSAPRERVSAFASSRMHAP